MLAGFAGCLSFYPTKNLGAFGDAGAICTSDDAFYEKCQLLRVHGSGHRNTYYHQFVGGMFRLDALQAVMLDVKLKHLDGWHDARRRNAAIYDQMLAGSKVKTPGMLDGNWSIYNQYVVRVPDRDAVKQKLADKGIGSRESTIRSRCICRNASAIWGIGKDRFPKASGRAARCWRCRCIRS